MAAVGGRAELPRPLLMQSATVRTVSVTIEPVLFGRAMRQAETAQWPGRWSAAARGS